MIRWGMIGLGNIAQRFARSLQFSDKGKLSAVASRTQNKRAWFKKEYPDVITFDNYEDLINSNSIDALYIALPHLFHAQYSKRALEANKAVLVEKPAALSLLDLQEVIDISSQKNVLFMEALKTRFIPAIDKIRDLINQGEIGRVVSIFASFCDNEPYDKNHPHSYLYDKEQGGAIFDVATYPLGFALDFIEGDIISIDTVIKKAHGVDVYFESVIQMDTGTEIIVEGAKDRNKPRHGTIIGTHGTIEVPVFNRPTSFLLYKNGVTQKFDVGIEGDDMFGEIEGFHEAYLNLENQHYKMTHRESLLMMQIIEEMKGNAHEYQD